MLPTSRKINKALKTKCKRDALSLCVNILVHLYVLDKSSGELGRKKELPVNRLITLGSPHLGTESADIPVKIINEFFELFSWTFDARSMRIKKKQVKKLKIKTLNLLSKIWDDVIGLNTAIEQMSTTGRFIQKLNEGYARNDLTSKIPHVLIGGNSVTLTKIYFSTINFTLFPGVGKIWDDLPPMSEALIPGKGDFLVELKSALMENWSGEIERHVFPANHLELMFYFDMVSSTTPKVTFHDLMIKHIFK